MPEKLLNFLEKKATPTEKERILAIWNELKAVAAENKLEMPALRRVPCVESSPWNMYWNNEKEYISVDFSDSLYCFSRDKVKDQTVGEECDTLSPEFTAKIVKFRYPRVSND